MTLVTRERYNAFRGAWLVVLLDAEERCSSRPPPQSAEMEPNGTRQRREATVKIEGLCPKEVLANVEHVEIWQGATLNHRSAETAGR